VPPSKKTICKHPGHELDEVRPRDRRNFVPYDTARFTGCRQLVVGEGQILDTLRIEMDRTIIVTGQAFQEFCESAFRAVLSVHERRNNG
jgi:hypothetical protein